MIFTLIPCHNNKREVLEVLRCFESQTARDIKVILVDDGSSDGTADAVQSRFPAASLLRGDGNLWWTGATELGLRHVLQRAGESDFVLFLNNDLTVAGDYVETLRDLSLAHGRAIVGSTLVDFDDHSYMAAGILLDQRLRLTVNTDRAAIDAREYDDVDVLSGRGTLVPVEVFRRVGTLNARRLPHYGADYEFAVRARRAGFRLLVSHRARVFAHLKITGLVASADRELSLKECREVLFSMRSKSNLRYYATYVWLCSDEGWRVGNTWRSAVAILSSTVGQTVPGRLLRIMVSPLMWLLRKPYAFFFTSYPLRARDIDRHDVAPLELVRAGIASELQLGSKTYFLLNDLPSDLRRDCPERIVRALPGLKVTAASYRHKIGFHWDRLRDIVARCGGRVVS